MRPVLLFAAISAAAAAICSFNVSTGSTVATTTLPELLSCYLAVPLNASLARQTLETARAVLDSYSYTDLLRDSGQPWDQHIDAYASLAAISASVEPGLSGSSAPGAITTDFEMHEAIGSLFGSFNDAHTQYYKPSCYGGFAVQPVGIAAAMVSNRLVLSTASLRVGAVDVSATLAPQVPLNAEIVAIDGMPALNALTAFANTLADGSDAASRFTAVINRQLFSYRSAGSRAMPRAANVTWTLRTTYGGVSSLSSIAVPWYAYTAAITGVANFTKSCMDVPAVAPNCSATTASGGSTGAAGGAGNAAVDDLELLALSRRIARRMMTLPTVDSSGQGPAAPAASDAAVSARAALVARELRRLAGTTPESQARTRPHLLMRALAGAAAAPEQLDGEHADAADAAVRGTPTGSGSASGRRLTIDQVARIRARVHALPFSVWDAVGLHNGVWADTGAPLAAHVAAVLADSAGVSAADGGAAAVEEALGVSAAARRRRALRARRLHGVGSAADAADLAAAVVDAAGATSSNAAAAAAAGAGAGAMGSKTAAGIEIIYNKAADYGLILYWDPTVPALRLRLSTFLPDAMYGCGPRYLSPCPTAASYARYSTCLNDGYANFVNAVTDSVFAAWKSYGAGTLIIDLTSNGGGYVFLGQAVMVAMVNALYNAPWAMVPLYDLRVSDVTSSSLTFLAANPSANVTAPYLTSNYLATPTAAAASSSLARSALSTTQISRSDPSWYTTGRMVYRGGGRYKSSALTSFFPAADLLSYFGIISGPTVTLDASNLLLVTDGLCGSMCGQFLRTLQVQGLARVLGVSGLPAVAGDTTSFIGGNVENSDSMAEGVADLMAQGWAPPPGVALLQNMNHSGFFQFNFASMVGIWDPSSAWEQWSPRPADLQLYIWNGYTTLAADASIKAAAVALRAMPVRLPDGTYAAGSTLPPVNNTSYLGATIALGIITGCLAIALGVALWFMLSAGKRGPVSSGATPRSQARSGGGVGVPVGSDAAGAAAAAGETGIAMTNPRQPVAFGAVVAKA